MLFKKKLGRYNREPNKIWIDKSNEFYKISMKLWLQENDIEIQNEGKSVAEVFIITLKNKIYIYKT